MTPLGGDEQHLDPIILRAPIKGVVQGVKQMAILRVGLRRTVKRNARHPRRGHFIANPFGHDPLLPLRRPHGDKA